MKKNNEKLKQKFLNHPLFPKLKEKYPYRDYEFHLDLMLDWWSINKKKLPVYISALDNWLKRTSIDPGIKAIEDRKQQRLENEQRSVIMNEKPNPEGLKKLEELRKRWVFPKLS